MTINVKTKTFCLALCVLLGFGACGSPEFPDPNNPGLEEFEKNPTPAGVNAATTGLLLGYRLGKNTLNGYVALLGVLGREAYVLEAGDARYITEMLGAPQLDPGSPAFGGNFWELPYRNIRNAYIVLHAVDKVAGLSEEQKQGVRGFTKTMLALEFLHLFNTRYTNGVVLDVDRPLDAPLAPIETDPAKVLAHINQLLDEGKTHLQTAGGAFSFPLNSGFEGFDTPATFLTFNRALKARVEVYAGHYTEALTALEESFLDGTGDMNKGVYSAYGTSSGDTTNALNNPSIFAHPSVVADAERKLDGTLDDRVLRKVKDVESRTLQGLTSSHAFKMYERPNSPIPIIRNEELLLLRAEAYLKLGDFYPAERDINVVRTRSGGLPALLLNASTIENELLKQRRYSLLFEGGHRWIDMRRFGKLNELPKDRQGDNVHSAFPIPTAELDARQ
jgi:hypothetical protein